MKPNKIISILLGTMALVSCNSHSHTFDTAWTSDSNYHWHKATCEHTEEISGKAEHSFDSDGVCTVCHFDSVDHQVTSDEWNAAFGPNTLYGIAENYRFDVVTGLKDDPINFSYIIDGNKLKEDEESYYVFENDDFYHFSKFGLAWIRKLSEETPKDIIGAFTYMIGSYDSYEYNPSTKSYFCKSKKIEAVTFEDISIKFNNKKLSGWSAHITDSEVKGDLIVNISYGGQTVNLPTESKVKLMGSFDGWTQGVDMQYVSGSKYVIESIHLDAGTQIKVKIDNDYLNKWATDSGTAVERNVIVIDNESNGEVLVGGDFHITVEADPESANYGVRVLIEHIVSPYNIYMRYKDSGGQFVYSTLETNFSKVVLNNDEKYIEYKGLDCETRKEYKYAIVNFDTFGQPNIIPCTLLSGGESNNFEKDGDFFVYKGDAKHVNFYLRFSLDGSNPSIFVEKVD